MKLSTNEARDYGKRGQAALAATQRVCIEGEHLSIRDIAVRLGVSRGVAGSRLRRLRGQPGAITWSALKTPSAKP